MSLVQLKLQIIESIVRFCWPETVSSSRIMSRIICPLYLGQAENMEWLVMDAEILSFMKQFHLWYYKNSFSDLPEL